MQNEWGQVRGCRDPFEPLGYLLREFIKKLVSIQNSSIGIDVERCCGVVAVALAISLREGLWMSLEDQVVLRDFSGQCWNLLIFKRQKKGRKRDVEDAMAVCSSRSKLRTPLKVRRHSEWQLPLPRPSGFQGPARNPIARRILPRPLPLLYYEYRL